MWAAAWETCLLRGGVVCLFFFLNVQLVNI